MKTIICGIGSALRGDDGIGPEIIKELRKENLDGNIRLLDCGNAPEGFLGKIEKLAPGRIIIIDAVDMGKEPGSIGRITTERIRGDRLSTHKLPLTLFLEYLKNLGAEIVFIGVQPKSAGFGEAMSPECRGALEGVRRTVLDSL